MTEEKTNLYRNANYNYDRRTITANGVNDIWAIDLVDMASKRAGYILNCVDVFSRYAQSVKLNGKTKAELERGINGLFNLFGNKPKNLWSDKESAVMSLRSWLESQDINLYHVENSYSGPNTHGVAIVERFNRTMREHMMQYKSNNPNQNYNQLATTTIKQFIPAYNNKIHSTTQRTPAEVYGGQHTKDVMSNQSRRDNEKKTEGQKLRIGQMLHIQKPNTKIRS